MRNEGPIITKGLILGKTCIYFFHIPKCASTSIKASLGIRERGIHVSHDRSLSWRQGIYKRFGWDTLVGFESVYSFTIVRNPWDRAVSAWKDKNPHGHKTLAAYLRHPFHPYSHLASLDDREFSRQASYEWHNMPQLDCISWDGQIVVKDIFRFEKLDEQWCEIQKETGINAPLLHMNRSERGDYRNFYDAETYDLVAKRYAKDISKFGYTFE